MQIEHKQTPTSDNLQQAANLLIDLLLTQVKYSRDLADKKIENKHGKHK